ncbi:uncharacterized protein LOC123668897 [Melitaea cinxia]|uniref:uncharacterized protein LOC123668897 n=1 Tax=Melitaea cinxia TaxID=113334 RepID=UPI001E271D63|nr:uncharacterized protein LOC123668897 [Melitaea cinxia]
MEDLGFSAAGLATVHAIRPHLRCWVKRRHGVLSFRLIQVLTGHGCFGEYLHQIVGREATAACHACGEPALRTGGRNRRRSVVAERGLSLPSMLLGSERSRCWSAVTSFCEEVMALKEAAE